MGGTSRMTGDGHVRICQGPGVKFPRPTRLLVPIFGPIAGSSKAINLRTAIVSGRARHERKVRPRLPRQSDYDQGPYAMPNHCPSSLLGAATAQ
jgi:hypothetical protein